MSEAVEMESAKEAAHRLAKAVLAKGFKPAGLHAYTDADGKPIYYKIRAKHPKTGKKWIRPMHRNGNGYELGEPAFPAGKPLYHCGSSPPSRGRLCGLWRARTAPMRSPSSGCWRRRPGARKATRRRTFVPLAGRKVTLWPDNDRPGLEHMQRVAAKLRALGCRVETIDVSRLELPEHGDAVDWLASRPEAGAAELLALPTEQPAAMTKSAQCADIRLDVIRADAITPEPVRWIWAGWLAGGKLQILAGAPGTGKTTLAIALAAAVTNGSTFPDGARAMAGSVLIASYEDDPNDTLAPRLAAAGADMARAFFLRGVVGPDGRHGFDAGRDLLLLLAEAERIGDLRLLVVDPVISAMGPVDSHRNLETRQALQPLADFAQASGVAVLGIGHFTKGTAGRDPLERLSGSLAFGALSRIVLGTAKVRDQDGTERRVFCRVKSNIGLDTGGFGYELEPATTQGGIATTRVRWGETLEGTARELLATTEDGDPEERTAQADAAEWLAEVVRAGGLSLRRRSSSLRGRRGSVCERSSAPSPGRASFRSALASARMPDTSGGSRTMRATTIPSTCHARQAPSVGVHGTHGHPAPDAEAF